ncbi:hypothetical protein [Mycobacterium palustre]|uniref:hypothetical protein n=1 Tax=Mycobacterium palustre TaxID=153971 RepID=UPI00114DFADD|nr:hypothetical protein [Mycobacterium palustre]MCV7101536.1 hypothetical protein [Mycobacterium palustre]
MAALAGHYGMVLMSKQELRKTIVLFTNDCRRRGVTLIPEEDLNRLCADIAADIDRELDALMDAR